MGLVQRRVGLVRLALLINTTIDRRSASERPTVLSAAIVLRVLVISLAVGIDRPKCESGPRASLAPTES